MKKRKIIAVLALWAVLAVSACGSAGSDSEEDTETEAQEASDTGEDTAGNSEAETETAAVDTDSPRLVSVTDLSKYVTLGQYKGLSLDNTVAEVTDGDVEYAIQTELKDTAPEVDSTVAAQEGDIVTINYVRTVDGETFDGSTVDDYVQTLGEGNMIDGFEDGLIGMTVGETKELNLTLPEEYGDEDLNGKDVVFQVTMVTIRRPSEFSDAWVTENTEYTTMEEYQTAVRTRLEEEAEEAAYDTLLETAWDTVYSSSEVVDYPQEDLDTAQEAFRTLTEAYAQEADMELEDFVESQGISMEDFEEQCEQYAQMSVKQNLVIQGIIDAEGMTLDDEECLAIQEQLIEDYDAENFDDLVEIYGEADVYASIGLLRVEEFIVANAEVSELISNGDTVGENANVDESDSSDADSVQSEDSSETVDAQTEAAEEGNSGEIDEELEDIDVGDETEDPTVE
ncbi:MAG: FKBP-type peptidyl-prolyl cis-trans isomerase [Clostridiales bacterium]|nr:FKBP-type peptidyl-prolyl cis-trans isomerase [Clostridiales bacterium]